MQDWLILRDLQSSHTSLPLLADHKHNQQTNLQVSNLQHEKHQPTTSPPPGMEKTSGVDNDFFKSFS